MKKLFDRNRETLTPSEDARVWNRLQEERRAHLAGGFAAGWKRSIKGRWMWPGLATGAAAAAVAVVFMVGQGAEDMGGGEPLAVNLSAEERRSEMAQALSSTDSEHAGALADTPAITRKTEGKEAEEQEKQRRESDTRRMIAAAAQLARSESGSNAMGLTVPKELYPVDGISQPVAELDKFPVETFEETASLRSGVVNQGGDPHFGGGRAGKQPSKPEMLYLAEDRATPIRKKAPEGSPVSQRWPPVSVGGTDPVNGEPYDAMFFENYGTNPFVAVEDDRFSTFAVDVDHASYTIARSYLLNGNLPPRDAVRVEEFINALDHSYPAPSGKLLASRRPVPSVFGTFAIHLAAAPSPYHEKNMLMRVGLKGREIDAENRKPANLTFVIDVSGSMNRENRLGLVKQSLHLLLDELRPQDQVALVVYGSNARTVLPPTHTEDTAGIRRAIDALTPEGSTNAEAGLLEGYTLASRMYSKGSINRVILCSDGVANVGNTGADSILERIHREAGRGIEMTAVGFGMGNYNDVLMEQLANKGDGNYYYVDSLREAKRIFQRNLMGTLETIAKDTKIQVEFTEGVVKRYRLLGYENRDVADRDFRNDAVDAGEVGAGHEVTALFEMRLEDDVDPKDTAATVRIRYKNPATGEVIEEIRELRVSMMERRLEDADPTFLLDAAAAQLAEILRGSYWAKDLQLSSVASLARRASRDMGRPQHAEELVGLIERAASLKEQ